MSRIRLEIGLSLIFIFQNLNLIMLKVISLKSYIIPKEKICLYLKEFSGYLYFISQSYVKNIVYIHNLHRLNFMLKNTYLRAVLRGYLDLTILNHRKLYIGRLKCIYIQPRIKIGYV